MQLNNTAMTAIWATNYSYNEWYNSNANPPVAPTQYVDSYGDDIIHDFYDGTWQSGGTNNYIIDNSRNSEIFREYNTAVGARNIVGLRPYDYSGTIMTRYEQGELSYIQLHFAIIVDDDTQQAIVVRHTRRYGGNYTPVEQLAIYTATGLRSTFYLDFRNADPLPTYTSNGGGATHIAKVTGQLKDLSSYTSDILMVSGGGGGGLLVGETTYTGKEAGGISGSGDNSADQSTGNAFGLGESGTNLSGGGSGLYGGYKGTSSKSGGAGSGYIGNSLVSNKKMVGYNVPTSSATGTKTESVEVFDSNYAANKPKAGNGHARIKLVAEPMPTKNLEYFRKNAGRFDNYVSFNMQDVIKSNDAKPYLLGDKDIVGYPGGGSWSYSYDSTSDTYTISTGSQVDYNFAVNRIQNPYRVIIECDVEPSSGRQAWISLVATYVNNDGNAVEVASSEGDNFLWISESIHMRLVFYNDVLPYIDYIRPATGNGPWSNLRISNFKITLFQ